MVGGPSRTSTASSSSSPRTRSPQSQHPLDVGRHPSRQRPLLTAVLCALLVRHDLRKPVFALLCVGIASHVVIDYFLWQPTGTTNLMLWPVLDLSVDYQGFYRSSDRWPAVVATITAGIVLGIDRFVMAKGSKDGMSGA